MSEWKYVIQTVSPDGECRDEVYGDSLEELAEGLVEAGYQGGSITVYDDHGFTVGWVGVDTDGEPYWRHA